MIILNLIIAGIYCIPTICQVGLSLWDVFIHSIHIGMLRQILLISPFYRWESEAQRAEITNLERLTKHLNVCNQTLEPMSLTYAIYARNFHPWTLQNTPASAHLGLRLHGGPSWGQGFSFCGMDDQIARIHLGNQECQCCDGSMRRCSVILHDWFPD